MVVRWWVVANPRRWSFDQLAATGSIRFTRGKIERLLGQVKVGDVVVGYESSPRRRLTALATVVKPFAAHEGSDEPFFELAPLLPLKRGLRYEELLADPIIGASQPMRNRNQGTLFRLDDAESAHLLQLLGSVEPALGKHLGRS